MKAFFFLDLGNEISFSSPNLMDVPNMAMKNDFRRLKYPIFRNRCPKILVWRLCFNRFRRWKSIFVAQCNFCLQFGDGNLFFVAQSYMCLQFGDEKFVFVIQKYHGNLFLQFDYI